MITGGKAIRTVIAVIAVLLCTAPAFATEAPVDQAPVEKPPVATEWHGGPHIGFSPYTGIIGVEIQKGHYGVTLGLPECIGLKYYPDERGYRWFYGVHAMHFSTDEYGTEGFLPYNKITDTMAGAGFGYRWRWWNHLDLSLSLSAVYWKTKYSGYYGNATEHFTSALPGLTLGYTF